MDEAKLLAEQQRYYVERAAEYDQWWARKGRYDLGPARNQVWFDERNEVDAVFEALPWDGDVLELAGGTGNWTPMLARRARHLTVCDGSAEAMAISRQKMTAAGLAERVSYQQVDLFAWEPERRWDGVFFGFWLSHVPASRLEEFMSKVHRALRPGAVVAFTDNKGRTETPTMGISALGGDVEVRELLDGRRFHIVKRYDDPQALMALCRSVGLDVSVATTANHFMYGTGRRLA